MTIKIETERLTLRPMTADDVEPHMAMMQDPATAKFLCPDGVPRPRAEEWRAAASMLGHWQIRSYGFFSVIEKATGEWVGRVGPWMPEGWPSLECGWSIKADRWGKGYGPEAAVASIRWTFDRFPELSRIISVIDPDNTNSQEVAKKVGEVFEFLGHRLDVWAADRSTWLSRFG